MSPTRPTKLILFDVDGTLIDAYGAGRRALEDAFSLVFERDDAAAYLDSVWFAGKTDLFIFREVAMRAGITPWDFERRYAELETRYLERLAAGVEEHAAKRVLPGVVGLLETIDDGDGLSLGLMTGNLEQGARIKIEPWGLNRFFPTGGFGSDALERSDIGLVALRRFERRLGAAIPPGEVLVVGDTLHDIRAARDCGFRVLAVGTGWADQAALKEAAPDIYFSDLSDTAAVLEAIGL